MDDINKQQNVAYWGKIPVTSNAKSAIARIANIEKSVSVIKNQRVTMNNIF